jgi:outer membrane protein OmpA-like peptidoglycan-associated protein
MPGGAMPGTTPEAAAQIVSPEMAYSRSDFVAGDDIIFEDYMTGERLGEFPSQWELLRGNAEIVTINGNNVIAMYGQDSWLEPLMKNPKNYLGDMFTVELDVFQPREGEGSGSFELDFMTPTAYRDQDVFTVVWHNNIYQNRKDIDYAWANSSGRSSGGTPVTPIQGDWNHIAVSFNKRALKVYFNGERVANVPNVKEPPGWVTFWTGHGEANKNTLIRNVRIAKGAVPLYDRMMSDGKFITYGITFDVGKSVIKPESMGEINRIVQLMNENPDLKFSVEGHTDSTGNAASNQALSEARSAAIVAKLVELGIAADRLSASGKGQNNPIADNTTDEGRAKNRRVEFVKQ